MIIGNHGTTGRAVTADRAGGCGIGRDGCLEVRDYLVFACRPYHLDSALLFGNGVIKFPSLGIGGSKDSTVVWIILETYRLPRQAHGCYSVTDGCVSRGCQELCLIVEGVVAKSGLSRIA